MTTTFKLIDFNKQELSFLKVVSSIYTSLKKGFRTENFNKVNRNYFPYILTTSDKFACIACLIHSYLLYNNKSKFKILDVGCGEGTFMMMIQKFIEALEYGKELSPYGIDVTIPRNTYIPIEKANGLTYRRYEDFDIVYLYHPIMYTESMMKLIDKVDMQTNACSLTIFNSASHESSQIHYKLMGLGFQRMTIYPNIYYKIKSI